MRSGWLLAAALLVPIPPPLIGQVELAMPGWLTPYPGVTTQTSASKALLESTYSVPDKPSVIIEHYRKLFASQGLPYIPNFDGMGNVVRAAAAECDLMITIRAQDSATHVRVDCAAKSVPAESWTALPDTNPRSPARAPGRTSPVIAARRNVDADARHQQLVKDLNIHKVYQDAPAPPLVWPEWLVHHKGSKLAARPGVDPAGHDYLKSTFVTSTPMTAVYAFYEDLLNAHEYRVHNSQLATGQTISGVVQNANGYVEGTDYPNGHPGPSTVIRVSFHRSKLNDPITVEVKFTTYAFQAPPPFVH